MNVELGSVNAELKGPLEFLREVQRVMQGQKFESFVTTERFRDFRPGTELPIVYYNWVWKGAGIGDFICYLPAAVWTAKNTPWARVKIFCPKFMVELVNNILQQTENPHVRAFPVENMEEILALSMNESLTRGPGTVNEKGEKATPMVNGTGGHLVDLGFAHFCNILRPPKEWTEYPRLNFDGFYYAPVHAIPELKHKKYVVLSPGWVSEARAVPGKYWTPIIDWIRSRGLSVVVLGKSTINNEVKVGKPKDLAWDKVYSLWDETSLYEAAYILSRSKAVIGLDNGLIQLASLTNARIVCGYNIVEPVQRRPYRAGRGKWRDLFITKEKLACSGCQTHQKNMFPHSFSRCLYGDKKCIDLLFEDSGALWIRAIREVLY